MHVGIKPSIDLLSLPPAYQSRIFTSYRKRGNQAAPLHTGVDIGDMSGMQTPRLAGHQGMYNPSHRLVPASCHLEVVLSVFVHYRTRVTQMDKSWHNCTGGECLAT